MSEGQTDPRIEACFEGDIPRECATCPGYGGRCCYGVEYKDEDRDCVRCIHREDCRSAVFNRHATAARTYRAPSSRAPASNVVIRSQPARSPPTVRPTVATSGLTPINGDWGEVFAQVGRDSLWNAITGVVETVFHFLKNHRWMK